MVYDELQEKFRKLAEEKRLLNKEINIETHVLSPTEAIGKPERRDFPLLKGKEFLMQATFLGVKGQAYTDAPSEFKGPLREVVDLKLDDPWKIALFIAALNAVMRHLNPDLATVHCKNQEPEECAREIRLFMEKRSPASVGIIGLQPAILEAMVSLIGPDKVRCIDRDEETRGLTKYGVPSEWGDEKGLENLFQGSDLILATGSSIANGSLPEILACGRRHEKPVFFYGTTIAGAALGPKSSVA